VGSVIDTGGASLTVLVGTGALAGVGGRLAEDLVNGHATTVGEASLAAAWGAAGGMAGALVGRAGASTTRGAENAAGVIGRSGEPLVNAAIQPIRNQATTISGRQYTGHAIDQMQNRGFMPSVVENTIKQGTTFPTRAGTTGFYDSVNNVRVIIDSASGRVVTVIPGAPAP